MIKVPKAASTSWIRLLLSERNAPFTNLSIFNSDDRYVHANSSVADPDPYLEKRSNPDPYLKIRPNFIDISWLEVKGDVGSMIKSESGFLKQLF